jgi:uncharacterized protein (TIGR02246 family)
VDAIDRLLAERAIERLLFDYVAANDAGDWEGVARLYTEDGRMSRPTAPDDFIVGRDAILRAFKARAPRQTRHVCANIRISFDTDEAALVASQILLFTAADQAPLVGSYADRCVREQGQWRFAERRGSLDFP